MTRSTVFSFFSVHVALSYRFMVPQHPISFTHIEVFVVLNMPEINLSKMAGNSDIYLFNA